MNREQRRGKARRIARFSDRCAQLGVTWTMVLRDGCPDCAGTEHVEVPPHGPRRRLIHHSPTCPLVRGLAW
jgi:hypothetical protein